MDTVFIRRWRRSPKALIAFLPGVPASYGKMVSYMHIGQHSEADYHACLKATKPTVPWEDGVEELLKELKRIGYEPVMRRRFNRGRA